MRNLSIIICSSLLLIFMCYRSANAQYETKKVKRYGIKGGFNNTMLNAKGALSTKMITTYSFGLFAKLPIINNIAIQPEINYMPKGGEITYNGLLLNGTVQFNFRYLEVPLLIVVNINDNFNIHAGPFAGILISSKVSNVLITNLFDFENNINKSDNNTLDAGFILGVGIDMGTITLGIRYNYGFTKVVKERSIQGISYTIPDAHNSLISFYISLSLN